MYLYVYHRGLREREREVEEPALLIFFGWICCCAVLYCAFQTEILSHTMQRHSGLDRDFKIKINCVACLK